ncbi:hypothetical protein Q3G72_017876 [Acer saccharum]|nr:hypothetical protein Q3G72_017876 [Acer saccharum]
MSVFSQLENIAKSSATSAVAWVGESGGAYNSGHHLVTDAFVYSFWYLDQLGMASAHDMKSYCRQTLIGGNYSFSQLKIKLGSTLQDKVIYGTEDNKQPCVQFVKKDSEMFGFTQGCLPTHRWDELNAFFKKSGLNAFTGRTIQPDGAKGAWDYTNAESLVRYTVQKNYSIHGWELGNELCGSGVGTRVAADQYASDTISLQNIVQNTYKDMESKH